MFPKTIGSSNDNQGQGSLESEPRYCKFLTDCTDFREECPISCKDGKTPEPIYCKLVDCTIPKAFEKCKETCTKRANGN